MDMKENSLSHVRLRQEQILGNCVWQGKLDMLNIVFIGLGKTLPPEGNKDYRLHRLLGALLSNDLSAGTKLDIMENEYGIPIEEGIRKEMLGMCNLGQGVYEQGVAQGIAQGIAQGEAQMILNMYQSGYAVKAIAAVAKKTITEIQNIIQEQQDK